MFTWYTFSGNMVHLWILHVAVIRLLMWMVAVWFHWPTAGNKVAENTAKIVTFCDTPAKLKILSKWSASVTPQQSSRINIIVHSMVAMKLNVGTRCHCTMVAMKLNVGTRCSRLHVRGLLIDIHWLILVDWLINKVAPRAPLGALMTFAKQKSGEG